MLLYFLVLGRCGLSSESSASSIWVWLHLADNGRITEGTSDDEASRPDGKRPHLYFCKFLSMALVPWFNWKVLLQGCVTVSFVRLLRVQFLTVCVSLQGKLYKFCCNNGSKQTFLQVLAEPDTCRCWQYFRGLISELGDPELWEIFLEFRGRHQACYWLSALLWRLGGQDSRQDDSCR